MYDNLKEKTHKTVDKSVDDTRTAAQNVHENKWVTPSDTVKNAGVEACTKSDNANIEARNIVSDPRITEQRGGTQMKRAEI
jgi:cell division septum initiation protein DivIVA